MNSFIQIGNMKQTVVLALIFVCALCLSEAIPKTKTVLNRIGKKWFRASIPKCESRWQKCVHLKGEYVEKEKKEEEVENEDNMVERKVMKKAKERKVMKKVKEGKVMKKVKEAKERKVMKEKEDEANEEVENEEDDAVEMMKAKVDAEDEEVEMMMMKVKVDEEDER
ncbi:unnamed protein product, partial [Darwinula stevensoni]